MVYRCLFEQSGHFKNVFRKYGFDAFDYDLEDNFDQTDFVVDLFNAIDFAFEDGKPLLGFGKDDFVIAFYPCTRFSINFQMNLLGNNAKDLKRGKGLHTLKKSIKYHNELNEYYCRLCKLVYIALRDGLKLVVENPSHGSYLNHYFPFEPTLVIENRREYGVFYKKPTMFYFFNCEPAYNFFFEPVYHAPKKCVHTENGIERSIMSDEFCDRFIREYILEGNVNERSEEV